MALGGGTFIVQNKELPGAYINFVSATSANPALSDRGIATMPLELDWGVDGDIFEVTNSDFQKNSREIFGYEYTHDKLKGLRDLFLNTQTLYAYKLTSGGKKASNTLATARYTGVRGNDIKIIVRKNADNESLWDVQTVLDTVIVDEQTVENGLDLVENSFVTWAKELVLEEPTAGMPLDGGENGKVTGKEYQDYLDKIEAYTYNAMGVVVTDEVTKSMFVSFNKRLRDEMGVKFQLVIHNNAADYYGVINVKNKTLDAGWSEASLVYWITGAQAGCAVNRSLQNTVYNGEFTVDAALTQTQLKQAIKAGEFTLHKVGSDIRVLADINSMVTITATMDDGFKENQTIRVADQIANDTAVLFNSKYLGVVPNDDAGRVSFWSDIVKMLEQLRMIRAIEEFDENAITVERGHEKKTVVAYYAVEVIGHMATLYMTVTVA